MPVVVLDIASGLHLDVCVGTDNQMLFQFDEDEEDEDAPEEMMSCAAEIQIHLPLTFRTRRDRL